VSERYDMLLCPWCGPKGTLVMRNTEMRTYQYVHCVVCHANGPAERGANKAVKSWNDRWNDSREVEDKDGH